MRTVHPGQCGATHRRLNVQPFDAIVAQSAGHQASMLQTSTPSAMYRSHHLGLKGLSPALQANQADCSRHVACASSGPANGVETCAELLKKQRDARNRDSFNTQWRLVQSNVNVLQGHLLAPESLSLLTAAAILQRSTVSDNDLEGMLDLSMDLFKSLQPLAKSFAPDQLQALLQSAAILRNTLKQTEGGARGNISTSKTATILRKKLKLTDVVKALLPATLPEALRGATIYQILACLEALEQIGITPGSQWHAQLLEALEDQDSFIDECESMELVQLAQLLVSLEPGSESINQPAADGLRVALDRLWGQTEASSATKPSHATKPWDKSRNSTRDNDDASESGEEAAGGGCRSKLASACLATLADTFLGMPKTVGVELLWLVEVCSAALQTADRQTPPDPIMKLCLSLLKSPAMATGLEMEKWRLLVEAMCRALSSLERRDMKGRVDAFEHVHFPEVLKRMFERAPSAFSSVFVKELANHASAVSQPTSSLSKGQAMTHRGKEKALADPRAVCDLISVILTQLSQGSSPAAPISPAAEKVKTAAEKGKEKLTASWGKELMESDEVRTNQLYQLPNLWLGKGRVAPLELDAYEKKLLANHKQNRDIQSQSKLTVNMILLPLAKLGVPLGHYTTLDICLPDLKVLPNMVRPEDMAVLLTWLSKAEWIGKCNTRNRLLCAALSMLPRCSPSEGAALLAGAAALAEVPATEDGSGCPRVLDVAYSDLIGLLRPEPRQWDEAVQRWVQNCGEHALSPDQRAHVMHNLCLRLGCQPSSTFVYAMLHPLASTHFKGCSATAMVQLLQLVQHMGAAIADDYWSLRLLEAAIPILTLPGVSGVQQAQALTALPALVPVQAQPRLKVVMHMLTPSQLFNPPSLFSPPIPPTPPSLPIPPAPVSPVSTSSIPSLPDSPSQPVQPTLSLLATVCQASDVVLPELDSELHAASGTTENIAADAADSGVRGSRWKKRQEAGRQAGMEAGTAGQQQEEVDVEQATMLEQATDLHQAMVLEPDQVGEISQAMEVERTTAHGRAMEVDQAILEPQLVEQAATPVHVLAHQLVTVRVTHVLRSGSALVELQGAEHDGRKGELLASDVSARCPQSLAELIKPGDVFKAVTLDVLDDADGAVGVSTRELEPWPGALIDDWQGVMAMAEATWASKLAAHAAWQKPSTQPPLSTPIRELTSDNVFTSSADSQVLNGQQKGDGENSNADTDEVNAASPPACQTAHQLQADTSVEAQVDGLQETAPFAPVLEASELVETAQTSAIEESIAFTAVLPEVPPAMLDQPKSVSGLSDMPMPMRQAASVAFSNSFIPGSSAPEGASVELPLRPLTLVRQEHSPDLARAAVRLATVLLSPLLREKSLESLAESPTLLATALHGLHLVGAQPSSKWLKEFDDRTVSAVGGMQMASAIRALWALQALGHTPSWPWVHAVARAAEPQLMSLADNIPVDLGVLVAGLHRSLTDPARPAYFSLKEYGGAFGSAGKGPSFAARAGSGPASSSGGIVGAVPNSFYSAANIERMLPNPQLISRVAVGAAAMWVNSRRHDVLFRTPSRALVAATEAVTCMMLEHSDSVCGLMAGQRPVSELDAPSSQNAESKAKLVTAWSRNKRTSKAAGSSGSKTLPWMLVACQPNAVWVVRCCAALQLAVALPADGPAASAATLPFDVRIQTVVMPHIAMLHPSEVQQSLLACLALQRTLVALENPKPAPKSVQAFTTQAVIVLLKAATSGSSSEESRSGWVPLDVPAVEVLLAVSAAGRLSLPSDLFTYYMAAASKGGFSAAAQAALAVQQNGSQLPFQKLLRLVVKGGSLMPGAVTGEEFQLLQQVLLLLLPLQPPPGDLTSWGEAYDALRPLLAGVPASVAAQDWQSAVAYLGCCQSLRQLASMDQGAEAVETGNNRLTLLSESVAQAMDAAQQPGSDQEALDAAYYGAYAAFYSEADAVIDTELQPLHAPSSLGLPPAALIAALRMAVQVPSNTLTISPVQWLHVVLMLHAAASDPEISSGSTAAMWTPALSALTWEQLQPFALRGPAAVRDALYLRQHVQLIGCLLTVLQLQKGLSTPPVLWLAQFISLNSELSLLSMNPEAGIYISQVLEPLHGCGCFNPSTLAALHAADRSVGAVGSDNRTVASRPGSGKAVRVGRAAAATGPSAIIPAGKTNSIAFLRDFATRCWTSFGAAKTPVASVEWVQATWQLLDHLQEAGQPKRGPALAALLSPQGDGEGSAFSIGTGMLARWESSSQVKELDKVENAMYEEVMLVLSMCDLDMATPEPNSAAYALSQRPFTYSATIELLDAAKRPATASSAGAWDNADSRDQPVDYNSWVSNGGGVETAPPAFQWGRDDSTPDDNGSVYSKAWPNQDDFTHARGLLDRLEASKNAVKAPVLPVNTQAKVFDVSESRKRLALQLTPFLTTRLPTALCAAKSLSQRVQLLGLLQACGYVPDLAAAKEVMRWLNAPSASYSERGFWPMVSSVVHLCLGVDRSRDHVRQLENEVSDATVQTLARSFADNQALKLPPEDLRIAKAVLALCTRTPQSDDLLPFDPATWVHGRGVETRALHNMATCCNASEKPDFDVSDVVHDEDNNILLGLRAYMAVLVVNPAQLTDKHSLGVLNRFTFFFQLNCEEQFILHPRAPQRALQIAQTSLALTMMTGHTAQVVRGLAASHALFNAAHHLPLPWSIRLLESLYGHNVRLPQDKLVVHLRGWHMLDMPYKDWARSLAILKTKKDGRDSFHLISTLLSSNNFATHNLAWDWEDVGQYSWGVGPAVAERMVSRILQWVDQCPPVQPDQLPAATTWALRAAAFVSDQAKDVHASIGQESFFENDHTWRQVPIRSIICNHLGGGPSCAGRYDTVWRLSLLYSLSAHTPGFNPDLLKKVTQRFVAAAQDAMRTKPSIQAVLQWIAPCFAPNCKEGFAKLPDLPIKSWLEGAEWSAIAEGLLSESELIQMEAMWLVCPGFKDMMHDILLQRPGDDAVADSRTAGMTTVATTFATSFAGVMRNVFNKAGSGQQDNNKAQARTSAQAADGGQDMGTAVDVKGQATSKSTAAGQKQWGKAVLRSATMNGLDLQLGCAAARMFKTGLAEYTAHAPSTPMNLAGCMTGYQLVLAMEKMPLAEDCSDSQIDEIDGFIENYLMTAHAEDLGTHSHLHGCPDWVCELHVIKRQEHVIKRQMLQAATSRYMSRIKAVVGIEETIRVFGL